MIKIGDTFHIGQICPESGIYKVKHCSCATEEQKEIPLVKGHTFPPCKNCGGKAQWEFVMPA